MAHRDVLILIPARMASSRLPGKPLADIAGEPMIVHVMRRAQAADIGPVAVATDSEAIAACVEKAGGRAVMTRADHASGSDRIFEALRIVDPAGRADIVVNVQGDLPTLGARRHRRGAAAARRSGRRHRHARGRDHRGAGAHQSQRRQGGGLAVAPRRLRALYFTRAHAPCGRRSALSSHRPLRLSPRRARALRRACPPPRSSSANGSSSCARSRPACASTSTVVDNVPLGVDTPADLERARVLIGGRR